MYLKDYMKEMKKRKRAQTWKRVKEKMKYIYDVKH